MPTAAEYQLGADRLLDWLASEYDTHGTSRSDPGNVQFYYKMPAVFASGGRRVLAQRTLAQFEHRFLPDGRFSLADDPIARPWAGYIGGWLAWGAGALGRFDLARTVVAAIGGQQDPTSGGFWHEVDGGRLFDSERTSAAAMGCVWAMETARAEAAARFLAVLLDAQLGSSVFYAYSDDRGRPIVDHADRNAYFAADDRHARPALFATTVASLVWAARLTGRRNLLAAARGYMHVVMRHQQDAASLPLATKIGWAALMLHAHEPDPALRDFARRNADSILARQRADGSIGFDEVVDVPKPVDRVWLIGWGCDCALTLLAVADDAVGTDGGQPHRAWTSTKKEPKVMKLRDRFRRDFGGWRDRLPERWKSKFDGVELGFDDVHPDVEIRDDEAIWPQAGNAGDPASADTFKALRQLDPDTVRVVIFGNDPYTRVQQATGRSFEQGDLTDWVHDIKEPHLVSPSLQTLLCAAAATSPQHAAFDLLSLVDLDPDEGFLWRAHQELARGLTTGGIRLRAPSEIFDFWAAQQVLWLNRTLTYSRWLDEHRPNHTALWAPFTARVIDILLQAAHQRSTPVVFALWGGPARALEAPIQAARERLGLPARVVRFARASHPQIAGQHFSNGNPLAAINELLDGAPITWL